MDDNIVTTDRLTKTYGSRTAVDGVTLTVRRGEVYGFLGPNGAGKTTTLRMLVGLIRPTAGSASLLGGAPGEPAVLRRVGALIEEPGFYPYLSGRANLRVLASYTGIDNGAVEHALDQVDLRDRGDDAFKSYSLGMKQRLGVAAAMLGEPDLLILDEPTNGLDPAGMADMRRLVRRLAERGQTVLLSSHLLAEVQQICDRVGVIADGRLLAESTVADLRGADALRVRATPVEQAVAVLRRVCGEDVVHVDAEGAVRVTAPAAGGVATAAEVVRALVRADLDVHEVSHVERSLEEAFFEMTNQPTVMEVA